MLRLWINCRLDYCWCNLRNSYYNDDEFFQGLRAAGSCLVDGCDISSQVVSHTQDSDPLGVNEKLPISFLVMSVVCMSSIATLKLFFLNTLKSNSPRIILANGALKNQICDLLLYLSFIKFCCISHLI